jgi:hypothetical protein
MEEQRAQEQLRQEQLERKRLGERLAEREAELAACITDS